MKTTEKKVYTIDVCADCMVGHIVMEEKIHPQILDEMLSFHFSFPCNTTYWDEYTQEEYEEEFDEGSDIPINSMYFDGWDERFSEKLTKYIDSTTFQERKELGLVFDELNKQVKPFRKYIQSLN